MDLKSLVRMVTNTFTQKPNPNLGQMVLELEEKAYQQERRLDEVCQRLELHILNYNITKKRGSIMKLLEKNMKEQLENKMHSFLTQHSLPLQSKPSPDSQQDPSGGTGNFLRSGTVVTDTKL